MIDFECPHCGNQIHAQDSAAGKRGQCKKCGESARVPDVTHVPFEHLPADEPTQSTSGLTGLPVSLKVGLPVLIVLLLFAGFIIFGANRPKRGQPVAVNRVAIAEDRIVSLTVVPNVSQGGPVVVSGTTNLPAETSLMISLEDVLTKQTHAETKVAVSPDGTFKSGPLGPPSGLKDGPYVASVVMPIARVQPESVRRIIGSDGQYLKGSLVETGPVGVSVHAETKFTIGGQDAVANQMTRAKHDLDQYRASAIQIEQLFTRLESAKSERLRDDSAGWGEFARKWKSDFGNIQKSIHGLDDPYARLCVGGPLGPINLMFSGIAFEDHGKYQRSKSDYAERLKELNDFLQKCAVITQANVTSNDAEKASDLDNDDLRFKWLNETYNTSVHWVKDKVWEEVDNKTGRVSYVYNETARIKEYIEIFCPKRNYEVRLLAGKMELKKDGKWGWVANGKWDAPAPK